MALPWFKVATDFCHHPKLTELEAVLGIEDGVGVIIRLWSFAAAYDPSGDIPCSAILGLGQALVGDLSYRANSMYQEGSRRRGEEMIAAVCDTGWLDPITDDGHVTNHDDAHVTIYRVHDWAEFNLAHVEDIERRRVKERERSQRHRDKVKSKNTTSPSRDVTGVDTDRDRDRDLEKEERESNGASAPAPILNAFELQSLWNSQASELLPRWNGMTDARKRAAQRALKLYPLEQWTTIIARVNDSDFCVGANDRQWRASPDWILKPDNIQKLMEGKYDNGRNRKTGYPNPDQGIIRSGH